MIEYMVNFFTSKSLPKVEILCMVCDVLTYIHINMSVEKYITMCNVRLAGYT